MACVARQHLYNERTPSPVYRPIPLPSPTWEPSPARFTSKGSAQEESSIVVDLVGGWCGTFPLWARVLVAVRKSLGDGSRPTTDCRMGRRSRSNDPPRAAR